MCFKKPREFLGKLIEKHVWNNKFITSIIGKKESSSNHEKNFYFFIERVVFPVMLMAVTLVTIIDIYFYCKYHSTSAREDPKFLYLFPIPVVAPGFFVVNFVMSVATAIKFLYCNWKEIQEYCKNKASSNEQNNETAEGGVLLENMEDVPRYNCTSGPESNNSGKNEECKLESNACQMLIRFFTLVLLFGIVYLFYHGFWIIIALLAYPGRILIGGIFIIPLILAVIPMWNTFIKIAENVRYACKKSSCCNCCYTWTCISSCNGCSKSCCNAVCMCSLWLAIFFFELVFWGLFITILFYISRFLLGSANLQDLDHTIKLALSYILIAALSGIMAWLNTDLVTIGDEEKEDQQDKKENQNEQQSNRENQNEQQNNQENQNEQQNDRENQNKQQENIHEIEVEVETHV